MRGISRIAIRPAGLSTRNASARAASTSGMLRTTNAELEKAMGEFDPVPGELRTWVEVVIEDASTEQDLYERVCRLADGRNFDVLKVLRGKAITVVGMDAGEASDDEAFESLLNDPASVFNHLLDEHQQFDDEAIQNLKAAFAELVEGNEQSEPLEDS